MWNRVLPALFGLLLVVVGVAVWRTVQQVAKLTPAQPVPQPAVVTKPPSLLSVFSTDPARGSPTAAITLVEFSDFECPYCAQSAPVLKSFLAEHPEVKLVWKDFPLPTHREAEAAAEAAQCAAQQGKFWEYHDLLFTNQSRLSADLYQQLARQLKLSLTDFVSCTQNHDPAPLIARNFAEGQAVGVDGTPFFVAEGQVHSGLVTASELELLIQP